jgi:hypothetical protein
MASAGEYPKVDGDVFYGKDSNMSYYTAALGTTMNNGNITVGATATLIKATNTSRKSILIRNNGSSTLYIGGNNSVTTSTGYTVTVGQSIYIYDTDEIYGIVASGTENVRYLETE